MDALQFCVSCKRLPLVVGEGETAVISEGKEEQPTLQAADGGDKQDELACCFCMGISQYSASDACFEAAKQSLVESGYEVTTFDIGISLPVGLLVRERLINLWLQQHNDARRITVAGLKDVIRLNMQELYKRLGLEFQPAGPFSIVVSFETSETEEDSSPELSAELKVLEQLRPQHFRQRHVRKGKQLPSAAHNQNSVSQALDSIPESDLTKAFRFPPEPCALGQHITVKYNHVSLFVGGRYNKLARGIPQTPWFVDGERKAETSVQELLADPLLSIVQPDEVKFSSAGREDCDVRMLGTGRPFVLEFVNPRKGAQLTRDVLTNHQTTVNTTVPQIRVSHLCVVDRTTVAALREGAENKQKTYACPIWTENPLTEAQLELINTTKDLVIQQKTPMRVSHRRTLMQRERTIYRMHIQRLESPYYLLELSTQSGTYIKEFVHGDLGRTQPNLTTIFGCDVDILSLDVTDVDLAWPPTSSEEVVLEQEETSEKTGNP
eukprot:m.71513 g.71513  ORF g.71513 m.71513 type:complete len:494 (-) comp13822_c0_seq1:134-1615(-)